MKKLLLFVATLLAATGAFAQKAKDIDRYGPGKMPFNKNGEVVFTKVVPMENCTQDQLYAAARLLCAEIFNSANDVLQLEDKENGMLVGKGNAICPEDTKCRVCYTLRIHCRDGRYKVDIYQISVRFDGNRTAPPSVHPAEECTDAESLKPDGSTKPFGKGFLRRSVIDISQGLLYTVETGMKRSVATGNPEEEEW